MSDDFPTTHAGIADMPGSPAAEQSTAPDWRSLLAPLEQRAERIVVKHPAVCLASALALGAALAWWIKRK